MGRKLALLIGNGVYDNKKFPPLVKAAADVNALVEVLRAPNIGAFDDVQVLLDESEESIRRTIGRFFSSEKKRDDLLLLYFTGHGDQDKRLQWYLICKDTEPEQLPTTAIPAYVIKQIMDSCNSAQQIVILDSCYSGAFFEGAKGVAEVRTHTTNQLVGRGRVVLTATTATQLAWEGDEPIPTSIFTRYLVQGLKTGEADSDKNGSITVDEWFEYAFEQVINETPNQNPTKWVEKQQGSIVVAKNPFLVEQLRLVEQERRRAEEERARIAEEEERVRLAEEERVRKAEEGRRRQAEAERTRLAEEEKERARLAEVERVKKAEEENRIPEPKYQRVLKPLSPGSLPDTFVRGTPFSRPIQRDVSGRELSLVEKARKLLEAPRAVLTDDILGLPHDKKEAIVVGIGILNLVGTSVWIGILLHDLLHDWPIWSIAVLCFIGEILLVGIVEWVDDWFVYRETFSSELIKDLIPISIAWGFVGWFLNPFVSLPLHLSFSPLILAVVGFLLGFFVNFFICLLLVRVLRL